jgi:uncharacterized membrane protein
MRTRTYRTLVELGGGLGFIVALFAAAEVADPGLSAVCSVNALVSCSSVLHSGRTSTLGIPDYLWGVLGFVAILVVGALASRNRKDARLAYALLLLTTAGVGLALYLLYVEVVEIGALCPVCLTAYFMGGVAWIGAIGLARRAWTRTHPMGPPEKSGAPSPPPGPS